ncbi:MAG: ice-binding family protein [Opitutaceae bacterium]|nr:ice-binding family protein [Opitutaceae bacterium]
MKSKSLSLLACAGFAALCYTASTAIAKPKPVLNSAQSFAVLAGSAVTLTDSFVFGDVGVDLGGAFTQTNSPIVGTVHLGDMVAQKAYDDFLLAYAALGAEPCDQTINGDLAGLCLLPGVYCVAAGSTTTNGTLTLVGSSTDTWIFKIGTGGTGALTGTNFTVVGQSACGRGVPWTTCNNNVFWWTAEAATLTDSTFIGSILAGTSITATRTSLAGQALAKVAVTLEGTHVSVCGNAKANEGVGNGVDGNTPGHDHNGGNDDPAFSPGNPGAKNKKG